MPACVTKEENKPRVCVAEGHRIHPKGAPPQPAASQTWEGERPTCVGSFLPAQLQRFTARAPGGVDMAGGGGGLHSARGALGGFDFKKCRKKVWAVWLGVRRCGAGEAVVGGNVGWDGRCCSSPAQPRRAPCSRLLCHCSCHTPGNCQEGCAPSASLWLPPCTALWKGVHVKGWCGWGVVCSVQPLFRVSPWRSLCVLQRPVTDRTVHANDVEKNTAQEFVSNRISNTKYTPLLFLPQTLMEQFRCAGTRGNLCVYVCCAPLAAGPLGLAPRLPLVIRGLIWWCCGCPPGRCCLGRGEGVCCWGGGVQCRRCHLCTHPFPAPPPPPPPKCLPPSPCCLSHGVGLQSQHEPLLPPDRMPSTYQGDYSREPAHHLAAPHCHFRHYRCQGADR
jgi:hypothetical protein